MFSLLADTYLWDLLSDFYRTLHTIAVAIHSFDPAVGL